MSPTISSAANPKARYVRRLGVRAFRARERRMVLEGVRLVEEALSAGASFDFVLLDDDLDRTERGRRLRGALLEGGVTTVDTASTLLADLSDTAAPQGILAVVAQPRLDLPATLDAVVVLDGVRDPGNLGTLLRTASASAVDGVILAEGTADPSNPKVVRAASGAHFRLPLVRMGWPQVAELCRGSGLVVRIADAHGLDGHGQVDWTVPWALVMGAEAEGPSARALDMGRTVRIDMPGPAESLNVSSAAAVILFEAVRQRALAGSSRGSPRRPPEDG
jgi:TrmH family RNA methyltransferase